MLSVIVFLVVSSNLRRSLTYNRIDLLCVLLSDLSYAVTISQDAVGFRRGSRKGATGATMSTSGWRVMARRIIRSFGSSEQDVRLS